MDSFCEVTMGAAEMISEPHPESDARVRIHDARVSEIAFVIRKVSNIKLDDDDVILLATVLARAVDSKTNFTRAHVEAELREAGRSSHRASQLAGAILR